LGHEVALDEKISKLIGDIYDGPRNPDAWKRVLNGILDHTGSRFILVSAVDLKRREYSTTYFHGADDGRFLDGVREYEADLYRADPMLAFAARRPDAGFTTMATAIAATGLDPADHPYLRWSADVLGTGSGVVRYTGPADGLTLGISVHPSSTQHAHAPADIRLFLMLFEHVERSMRLAARPPDFDHASEARLLIDGRGMVRRMSDGAAMLLAQGDGLRVENGRLHAVRSSDTARLGKMIAAASQALSHGTSGGALALPRPSGRRDWLVLASPLPRTYEPFATFAPAVMVRIVDPETGAPPGAAERWTTLFGLTATEARLLETLLTDHGDLRAAAERLGMLYSTARVHMRHIFDKTGARGQAPLMRLLQRIEG